jgi:hypothetical protein
MKTKFMPVGAVYIREMSVMGYWLLVFIMHKDEMSGVVFNGEHSIQVHLNEFLVFLKTKKIVLGEGFEYKKYIDECFVSEAVVIAGDGNGSEKRIYKIFKEVKFNVKSGTALLTLNREVENWAPFIVRNGIPGFVLYNPKKVRHLKLGRKPVRIREAVKEKEKKNGTKGKGKGGWPVFRQKLKAFFSVENLKKLVFEEEKPKEGKNGGGVV